MIILTIFSYPVTIMVEIYPTSKWKVAMVLNMPSEMAFKHRLASFAFSLKRLAHLSDDELIKYSAIKWIINVSIVYQFSLPLWQRGAVCRGRQIPGVWSSKNELIQHTIMTERTIKLKIRL